MLTCYDYPSAKIQDACGIDIIFVGDSLATNVLGYNHQNDLRLEEMRHHVRAVARGISRAYLLSDIPYLSSSDIPTILGAAEQLSQDGVDGVKVEGFRPEVFEALAKTEVEPWAHLGFTPQLIKEPAMQAKDSASAKQLLNECQILEAAGAVGIILELIPENVAELVAKTLRNTCYRNRSWIVLRWTSTSLARFNRIGNSYLQACSEAVRRIQNRPQP